VLIALFAFQRFGASAVGKFCGPVIVVWFGVLAATGVAQIAAGASHTCGS